jgi:hypothetical protein
MRGGVLFLLSETFSWEEERPKTQIAMRFPPQLKILAGWLAWLYTIAVILAEIVIGGQAAHLVLQYYDFELNHISIDSFCRDIYKDTKNLAQTYLIVGCGCMLLCLAGFIWFLYWRFNATARSECFSADLQPCVPACDGADGCMILDLAPIFGSFFSTVTALAYGAFLTWKRHSLSHECADFWNTSVSPDFLLMFHYAEKLLIATGVVGGFWVIVGSIGVCLSAAASA